jgi:HAD superfamily hydrolase (TIGR01509 family)
MKLGLAIASSSDPSWLDENLARVGLGDAFEYICCCDGELPPKPAPDLYLQACTRLDVAPAAALAIEDSPTGLLAARAAGMPTLGVLHRLTLDVDLPANLVFSSLADLSLENVLGRL